MSLWDNTVFINRDVVAELSKLKLQDGPDLQVHGSGRLIQTLLEHDLVDELAQSLSHCSRHGQASLRRGHRLRRRSR